MQLKNIEMSNYLNALNQISNKVTGKLGYAVARNIRKISDEVFEFEKIKNELINKYGEDSDGQKVIRLNTEPYQNFLDEIQEYKDIAHEVDIFMIDAYEVWKSDLTAKEIISLDFMINDEETIK